MLLITLALAAAQPGGSNAALAHDVRCAALLSGVAAAATEDADMKNSATMLATYFLGRIDGRAPKADLSSLIKREMDQLQQDQIEKLTSECAAEVQKRMGEIEALGAEVSSAGE